MWHWLGEHHAVFRDITLIWVTPVLVAMIAAKMFRQIFRGDKRYAALVARPGGDGADETERSRPAA